MLSDTISKFNAEASRHLESQSNNPFSGRFKGSPSTRRPLSKEEYGRPVAGSKTEWRGLKAKSHITKEILELCGCIHDLADYSRVLKTREQEEEAAVADDDGLDVVTFGELFQLYSNINNKVVGLLIAAKKKGLVYFEKEILFQRRDDDVLVALTKPIDEITAILKREIGPPSPMPGGSSESSPCSSAAASPVPARKNTLDLTR